MEKKCQCLWMQRSSRRRRTSKPCRKTVHHHMFGDSSDESADPDYIRLPCKKRKPRKSAPREKKVSGLVVNLDDSDNDEDLQAALVKSRVETFFKSSNLMSDDDDVVFVDKATDNKVPAVPIGKHNIYSVLSDSDDDIMRSDSTTVKSRNTVPVVCEASTSGLTNGSLADSSRRSVESCEPSTSGVNKCNYEKPYSFVNSLLKEAGCLGTSSVSRCNDNEQPSCSGLNTRSDVPKTNDEHRVSSSTNQGPISKKKKEDDVMAFVDSILLTDKPAEAEDNITDLQSLEDFRKETEVMLQNVSSMLDSFKGAPPKKEPEPPKEVPKPAPVVKKDTPKKGLGSCPVCLEPLVGNVSSTVCGHIFCNPCITKVARTMKKCPTCRKTVNSRRIHPLYI